MSERLWNKTALVTGSTSNIGQAIAEGFAAEGAHVIVSGRNRERGAQVVEGIRASGDRADFLAADLDGSVETSTTRSSAPAPRSGRGRCRYASPTSRRPAPRT